jgi:hypothetical protein
MDYDVTNNSIKSFYKSYLKKKCICKVVVVNQFAKLDSIKKDLEHVRIMVIY